MKFTFFTQPTATKILEFSFHALLFCYTFLAELEFQPNFTQLGLFLDLDGLQQLKLLFVHLINSIQFLATVQLWPLNHLKSRQAIASFHSV